MKIDAHVIELALTTFLADPKRLNKFGRGKDKTWIATSSASCFVTRIPDHPVL